MRTPHSPRNAPLTLGIHCLQESPCSIRNSQSVPPPQSAKEATETLSALPPQYYSHLLLNHLEFGTRPLPTPQEKIVTGLGASCSNLPTVGSNAHVKSSDVIAFGSKALQPRVTTKDPKVASTYIFLVQITKNEGILDVLILNCQTSQPFSVLSLHVRQPSVPSNNPRKALLRRC